MLGKVLRALSHGGTYQLRDLAKELGISRELLESMMEELNRMGYTRREVACSARCVGCRESSACLPGSRGQMWTVTERGLQVARRMG
jgi:predicted ArsR family transcriptional regulator